MKREFVLKALFLMPVAALVIGMNYTMDPAHLFQSSYESGIANLLIQGQNIANIDNYDDRLVQKLYIENSNAEKDIVILGSSHAMAIHASMFPGKTVFNHSVSGAILEDHIAITEIYHKQGIKLSTVIIALDPWLLNRNHDQIRRLSIEKDFQDAAERLELPILFLPLQTSISQTTRKYFELISPAYFQESIRFFFIGLNDPSLVPGNFYPTSELVSNVAIRLSDGSLSRSSKERSRGPSVKYANATVTLKKFDEFDPDLKYALETWVVSLKEDGTHVVFLLTPYHPDAYSYLVESMDYRIILDAQSYYEELARRHQIDVLGSYDPGVVQCMPDEFYDEQHPRESCMEKILNDPIASY